MEKKSIGILTIHNSLYNYGGTLQGYALYSYLQSLGHDVEIIDLHRPCHADFVHSYRFPIMRQPKSIVSVAKGVVKEMLGIKRWSREEPPKPTGNVESALKFEAFNKRIRLSQPYNFIPDLYKTPPHYDVYVSGSDQLWNPTQYYCIEPYFLTFVKDKRSKKISYGTSIGIADIEDAEKKLFAKWLASYDTISVRERQAQQIVQPLVGKTVYRVPDPTFLLEPEEWSNMAGIREMEEDYVLVFSLGREKCLYDKAMETGAALDWRVKVLDPKNGVDIPDGAQLVADAGPLDFMRLIRDAKLVLTDSFHATVFSLIMGARNFYTYLAPHADRGSRMVDLLELFGLSDRIVYSTEDIPHERELEGIEIDHANVGRIMAEQRKVGRDFLKKAIL